MNAHAGKAYDAGFVLDESNLRKINNIIDDRIPENKKVFKVSTNNSKSFECSDIETVINEDNDEYQAIERVYINVSSEITYLSLSFKEKSVILDIEGNDRDIVFLLYSDLDTYLKKEVVNRHFIPGTSKGLLLQLVAFFILYLAFIFMLINFNIIGTEKEDIIDLNRILESSNTNEKLNYIISELNHPYKDKSSNSSIYMLLAVPFSMVFFFIRGLFYKYAYPYNIFVIGKKIEIYKKYKYYTERIVWGVIVSFLISVTSGFILK
ncbi:hypothetical protein [Shewanella chilikensis]|uniref:hypothetical protein n=1 Tax=Shewanella chilikensis TaxID=558541 RepID=UPI003A979E99